MIVSRMEAGPLSKTRLVTLSTSPASWLPTDLKEGDVVVVEQQELVSEDELSFATGYRGLDLYVDSDATAARREHARNLRDRLPHSPSGDLEL